MASTLRLNHSAESRGVGSIQAICPGRSVSLSCDVKSPVTILYGVVMDVLLNGHSISAEKELHSLCCMMGKTMSFRCHFLAANGWRLID